MTNNVLTFALLFETAVAALVSYIEPLQVALNSRGLACPHFGVPAMAFFALLFFFDEVRRIYLRSGIDRSVRGKVTYRGWVVRNTYW